MRLQQRLASSMAVLAILVPATPAAGSNATTTPPTPPIDKVLPPPVEATQPTDATGSIDSAGATPTATASTGALDPTLAATLPRPNSDQRTAVEILTTTPDAAAQLAAVGAVGEGSVGGLTLARLTTTQIRGLSAQSGVLQIRKPVEAYRGLLGSPAPTLGPVYGENWQFNLGEDSGKGVKVGIIDFFDPTVLATEISTGELLPIPPSRRACYWLGAVCTFGSPGYTHGNSVAEVLSDGAPAVTLYLAEVGTLTDYLLAIDWFAANGVTIINHSALGAYDGPGDGTGPSAGVVDYAVSKGIAWFNAAGNAGRDPHTVKFSGGYFRGVWNDSDNDKWMNFYGSDESLGVYCGALLGLRWSDWGAARTDYDLWISDYRYSTKANGTKVLASGYNQSTGSLPLEGNDMRWLCNTNPAYGPVYDTNNDGFVSLWVQRTTRTTAPSTGDILEIMVNQGWVEYPTNAGSASIPFGDTKNPGGASIGAAFKDGFGAEFYSSRGPTNDGRAKPDFIARGCLSTKVDGSGEYGCDSSGFAGTSAATPVVAAMAATGQGEYGLTRPRDLITWLSTVSISRTDPVTKDNNEGWGEPGVYAGRLPTGGAGYAPQTPTRVLDTRGVNGQQLGAPIGPRAAGSITTITLPYAYAGTTVALNVAMVNASGNGYLQVYPSGMSAPGATSSINVAVGQTRANFVLVPANGGGQISFYTTSGGHIIADVVGKFTNAHDAYRTPLAPLTPYTTYDTHSCGGCSGGPLAGGTYVDIPLAGTHSVDDAANGIPSITDPAPPVAAVISVTVSGPAGKGFLSVAPPTTTNFTTSNLNFTTGESLSGTTFIPLSSATQGKVRLYVSQSAHVRVDVLGYFGGNRDGGGWFTPMVPTRAIDTRESTKPGAGATIAVPIEGHFGVPGTYPGSVFVNTTSVSATGPGQVAAGRTAADGTFITTSIPAASLPVAAGSLARLDEDGSLLMRTTVASNLIADVAGWFSDPSPPLTTGVTPILENSAMATIESVAISDDGSLVAYVANLYSVGYGVHVWDATNGDRLLFSGFVDDMWLSGDGSTVVVTRWNSGLNVKELLSVRVSDGQTTTISMGYGGEQLDGVSDDGELLLFRSTSVLWPGDFDSTSDLYIAHRSTGQVGLAIPALAAVVGAPIRGAVLNGPGTVIVAQDTDPATSLRRYDLATSSLTTITLPSGYYYGFSLRGVSDDGQKVLADTAVDAVFVDLVTVTARRLGSLGIQSIDGPAMGVIDSSGSHAVLKLDIDLVTSGTSYAGYRDVVLMDLDTGIGQQVNRTWTGAAGNQPVIAMSLSGDGKWVVYATKASNTTPTSNESPAIYLVEVAAL